MAESIVSMDNIFLKKTCAENCLFSVIETYQRNFTKVNDDGQEVIDYY